ncbi:MAG TPA: ABC transporter permease [Blastocatellia bacterium]
MFSKMMARMRALLRKSEMEIELDEELRYHIEQQTEQNIRLGMNPEEARSAARKAFGGVEQSKELSRDARGVRPLEDLWQDLRFGVRMLAKNPGFTLIAVITLGLGIGANTTIFSVVNAMLFRPLPYTEADRLMAVVLDNENSGRDRAAPRPLWSYPKFSAFREHQTSFDAVAAYAQKPMAVNFADQSERIEVEIVTADYFKTLGIKASLGRVFAPEEDRAPESHPVVLIGDKIWRRRFGADPKVIGQTIHIRNLPFTIIGVAPAGFAGQMGTAEIWAPMMMSPRLMFPETLTNSMRWLKAIARLKPGVAAAQALAEVAAFSDRINQLVPDPSGRSAGGRGKEIINLIPLKDTKIDPLIRRSFLILLAAVGFVLMIACANVANLSLARAVGRRKEFAVRLALGAGKWRIVRQVLTESLILAALGAAAGLVVALLGINWLVTARPWNDIGFWSQYAKTFDYFWVGLDLRVLAFNLLVGAGAGVAFGIFPALQVAKQSVNETLKESPSGAAAGCRSPRGLSARGALVVAQLALSLTLLAGAGLAIKSFWKLLSVKLGFDPQDVITMSIGTERQGLDFYQQLLERTQRLPGVESASLAGAAPLSDGNRGGIEIEGRAREETAQSPCLFNIITPDYFKTFSIAVLRGRVFNEHDRPGAPRVAVISRATALVFWRDENPLGRRIQAPWRTKYETNEQWIEIVGVVDDVKYGAPEEEFEPVIYLPQSQPTLTAGQLALRVAGDPAPVIAAIRKEVYALDKTVPLYGVISMSERIAKVVSRYRFSAWLMGAFAAMALILAAIGIYGVVSYAASARTREIGVRIALGAQTRDIARLIITDGIALIGAGMSFGLIAAFIATRVLKSQLYGVETNDPLTFLIVSLALAVVGLAACYIPARRATKVDPLVALRCD